MSATLVHRTLLGFVAGSGILFSTLTLAQSGISIQLARTGPTGPTGLCPSISGVRASSEVLRPVVLDAPYSGVGRNSITRVLADGNRIVHSNTTRYFRDGRGRTRTEYVFEIVGPIPLDHTHTIVVIDDPVEGRRYVLYPDTRRADAEALSTSEPTIGGHTTGRAPAIAVAIGPMPKVSSVDLPCNSQTPPTPTRLGEKVIDGIKVQGTRVESTIPAGQIGNERAITIRSEEWFSARLGVAIAATSQDPVIGDSAYRLEEIVQAEPDPSLFKVPPDYVIQSMPSADTITQQNNFPPSARSPAEPPRPSRR
jgi:hypothetical protein